MRIQYTNKEQTSIEFEDATGVTWHGLKLVNGKVQGDGQIPDAAKKYLADGGTITPYTAPPEGFTALPRPAFMFMLGELNITEEDVLALIAQMPSTTPDEVKAQKLAGFVFANQNEFTRDNQLLNDFAAMRGLTKKQVDDAWRGGESLTW